MAKNRILDAVKIQSRVVISIVKALEQEIGKEKMHRIVREAIAGAYVEYRERRGYEVNSHRARKWMAEWIALSSGRS